VIVNVFIIDNYDSFTYNLYQYIGEILSSKKFRGEIDAFTITVKRNDEVTLEQIQDSGPDRIIISPGPGSPDDEKYFGICSEAILTLGKTIPLLGVCLGMQGIVHTFGGEIVRATVPMHGKISPVTHNGRGVFANIPDRLEVMRYHSLVANPAHLPDCLEITAAVGDISVEEFKLGKNALVDRDFEIMGVQHREFPIIGIQFHPESFATEGGKELISNFLAW